MGNIIYLVILISSFILIFVILLLLGKLPLKIMAVVNQLLLRSNLGSLKIFNVRELPVYLGLGIVAQWIVYLYIIRVFLYE